MPVQSYTCKTAYYDYHLSASLSMKRLPGHNLTSPFFSLLYFYTGLQGLNLCSVCIIKG